MAVVTIPVCETGCPCGAGNYNFCGQGIVESEICFVPSIDENTIERVDVEVDPMNFQVELICCNLIVVCGFITKKVYIVNVGGDPILLKTKDIPVQINVPAEICDADSLQINTLWAVTGVEVCTGCYTLTCPTAPTTPSTTTKFHKLIEKDIIAVQVDRTAPLP
jgi:hypothetical protein